MMEWAKVSLEKLFSFLTALIPGSAVLLLFHLHQPDLLWAVWNAKTVGYQTKIAILLFCAFATGWTLSYTLSVVLCGIGGVLGVNAAKGEDPSCKPWENKNWRSLLSNYLGSAAPEDIEQIFDKTFEIQMKYAESLQEPQRSQAIQEFSAKRSKAILNEFEWKGWWTHFHSVTLAQQSPTAVMILNLAHNFATTGILLLCAVPFTKELRQWWLVSGCICWILLLVLRSVGEMMNIRNPWSSFALQMEYLQNRVSQGKHFTATAD
jgi:hypothetical protein